MLMIRKLSRAYLARSIFGANVDCDVASRVLELGRKCSLCMFHDNGHFIHILLEQIPSAGRLRSHKV